MSGSFDRLSLLATFVRIVERGSISAAARDLGLSQASASRQLQALEARLDAVLLERTTHSLTLTEAGASCLADARALLDGWSTLEEQHTDDGAVRGALKVVAPVALGQGLLAEAAFSFQAGHPEVRFTWLLEDGDIRFAEIGCDLWIRIGAPKDDTLVVRELGRVERLVVAAPELLNGARGRGPERLSDLPCAALEQFEGVEIPLTDKKGRACAIRARAVLTTNNLFVALAAARAGRAFAVAPLWLVEADLRSGRLIDAAPGWRAPTLPVVAAFRPAARRPKRLARFIEHIAQAVGAAA
ncbi:MAG: LysR family transcriptional regulator [Pseudomonadota bacterium]